MTNVYCTAPFNSINVTENGVVRTCCQGNVNLVDLSVTGAKNLTPLLNSAIIKEIQDAMLKGIPHEANCGACAMHERTTGDGVTRERFNKFFPDIKKNNGVALKTVMLRLNNLCNLGCVYCSPSSSSVWEARKKIPIKNTKVKDYQENLYDWVLDHVSEIQEIQLLGGEPMLIKQNYSLIKALPLDARIIIVTNLAYELDKLPCLPDLLKRPKENILWNISFENIGKQFEYARSGADWSLFSKNLKLLTKLWPHTVNVSFCYNILSAFDMLKTVKQISYYGIHKYQFVSVWSNDPYNVWSTTTSDQLNVFSMPPAIKKLAAEEFRKVFEWREKFIHPNDLHLYPWYGANEIYKKLQSNVEENAISKKEFYEFIDYFDSFSKEKFETLWPELKSLIDLHLQ